MKRARKMNKMKRIILPFVIAFFIFEYMLMGAGSVPAQEKDAGIYKEAKRATYRKEWQKAASLFETLKRDFPDSRYYVNSIYWVAYNLDKLGSGTENLKLQIELKQEAVKNLDYLIGRYKDSIWAATAGILKIKISRDLVMRGRGQYLENILQALNINEKVEDDARMAALDALFQIDKEEAFAALRRIFTGSKNTGLWEKALYWLQPRKSETSLNLLYAIFKKTKNQKLKLLLKSHLGGFKSGEISGGEVVVPVRVFYRNSRIDNLNRANFKLFEGNREQIISGFQIKKKKIKAQDDVPSRYFVLAFRVTNYNKQFREGVAHLFKNILRKKDQLLVFINKKRLAFDNLTDIEKVYAEVNRALRKQSNLTRGEMDKYLKEMERRLNPDKFMLDWENDNIAVVNLMKFLDVYWKTWKDYKEKYLLPDLDTYYRFARHLEKIKKEKWVINFYQVEMFPELASIGVLKERAWEIAAEMVNYSAADSYNRTLSRQLLDIDKLRNISGGFPIERISKLFYRADATLHTVFMHTARAVLSKDFEYTRIANALEKSFGQISRNTGGDLIASNDLESALTGIAEKESAYYVLNYVPANSQKPGKIKIKVSSKKYEAVYDENMRLDYIAEYLKQEETRTPSINIKEVRFKDKKLNVFISDFLMESGPQGEIGRIDVRVRIRDDRAGILFDQRRNVTAGRSAFRIDLSFEWLQNGKFDITVEVKDLLTGKKSTKTIRPAVK
jgi:hypothetical protein